MNYNLEIKNVKLTASVSDASMQEFVVGLKVSLLKDSEGKIKSVKLNSDEVALGSLVDNSITVSAVNPLVCELQTAQSFSDGGRVLARLPGQILEVLVKPGQKIAKGDLLAVLDAMKMENDILASKSGTVKSIKVAAKDIVKKGQLLIEIE